MTRHPIIFIEKYISHIEVVVCMNIQPCCTWLLSALESVNVKPPSSITQSSSSPCPPGSLQHQPASGQVLLEDGSSVFTEVSQRNHITAVQRDLEEQPALLPPSCHSCRKWKHSCSSTSAPFLLSSHGWEGTHQPQTSLCWWNAPCHSKIQNCILYSHCTFYSPPA